MGFVVFDLSMYFFVGFVDFLVDKDRLFVVYYLSTM